MEPSLKKLKTDIVPVPDQLNNWETTKLHPLLIDQVIDTVFTELSLNDLKKARSVCKFWNTRAVDEILTRETKIVIANAYVGLNFLARFTKSQDKKLFTKIGTIEFKTITAISYITAKGFLNNDEIAIKNMVFNFNKPSNKSVDQYIFAILTTDPDLDAIMDFDQFFNQLSKCSKHLKSLTLSAPNDFFELYERDSYFKILGKKPEQILAEIEESIIKWLPGVHLLKLESLSISSGFSRVLLKDNPTFYVNLFEQGAPKLSILDLGFDSFPSTTENPQFNRILLQIGPQLTNLTIEIRKQISSGIAQTLCDFAQGGMLLKKLSLSVLYEFDGQEAGNDVVFPSDDDEALVDAALEIANGLEEEHRRAQIRQEILLLSAFFKSQKDSIKELKINLERADICYESLDERIILPVFSQVTSLVLFHRLEDYDMGYDERSNYENLLSKMSLPAKFPKLEKISLDSETIGYNLIHKSSSTTYGFMKTLEYTYTKQEIFPSSFLRAVFSRVETLVIKYPPSSKSIYHIHPNVNGSHIPWKNSLENLEINYPLYDLERFDFSSLRFLTGLMKLKFICIPTDIVRYPKTYKPNLTPLKALNLTSIIFQNYRIPRDHKEEILKMLPHFQSL